MGLAPLVEERGGVPPKKGGKRERAKTIGAKMNFNSGGWKKH